MSKYYSYMRNVKLEAVSILSFVYFFVCIINQSLCAQNDDEEEKKGSKNYLLISDVSVQIEATKAINDMYNFKFERAAAQFLWLKEKYENHPLPYFLLGLNEWWKIMPNAEVEIYDEKFLMYMDSAIYLAEKLYEVDSTKVEGAFFLSASCGFVARLHSDRSNWIRAAAYANKALNYLDDCRSMGDLNPELMFGDGLFNYFSVWIRDNYPNLRPFLFIFEKGDKELGLKQLTEVAHNAFYTRTEAQFWLMRILFSEERDYSGALVISEYLHKTFPDNAYFHRYYARMLFSTGQVVQAKMECEEILQKIDKGMPGYEQNSGRWASYFLGSIMESSRNDLKALEYYEMTIAFGEEIEAFETGYFLYALLGAARVEKRLGHEKAAKRYLKRVKKYAKRSHPAHKQARRYLKSL